MENHKKSPPPPPAEGCEFYPNYHLQPINPIFPVQTLSMGATDHQTTLSTTSSDDRPMEDLAFTDIFEMLSNVELYPALPPPDDQELIVTSSNSQDSQQGQLFEKAESSEQKIEPNSKLTEINFRTHLNKNTERRKSSNRHRGVIIRPRRSSGSIEFHNTAEKTRKERIGRKIKALQDLIPNCNTRDKISILDDAIRYIKALENQIKTIPIGVAGCSLIQTPNMILPAEAAAAAAGYQMAQIPCHFPQIMLMNPARIGMGMFNFNHLPFILIPSPYSQSSPAAAPTALGMNTAVGPMSHLNMPAVPLHRFQSVLSSSDSNTLRVPPAHNDLFRKSFPK